MAPVTRLIAIRCLEYAADEPQLSPGIEHFIPDSPYISAVRTASARLFSNGDIGRAGKHDPEIHVAPYAINKFADQYLSDGQKELFAKYSYNKMDFRRMLVETFDTQANIIATLAMPGYHATKYGITAGFYRAKDESIGNELSDSLDAMSDHELASDMRSCEFQDIVSRLALGPNGSYAAINFKLNADGSEALLRRALGTPLPEGSIKDVSHQTLCEKIDGKIVLSKTTRKFLATILKLDNRTSFINPAGEILHGSKGCPVRMDAARVHNDDFTEQQWKDMLDDTNVARYNEAEGLIHFMRSPIKEYCDILATYIELA